MALSFIMVGLILVLVLDLELISSPSSPQEGGISFQAVQLRIEVKLTQVTLLAFFSSFFLSSKSGTVVSCLTSPALVGKLVHE